jgi:integrase
MLASGLSTSTVRELIGILRHALRDAVDEGLVYRNVVDAVRRPPLRRDEVVPPDADAVAAILHGARATPFHVLFSLMANTGVRRGEAIGLRWSDVDLERRTCAINQTYQRVKGRGLVVQPPKSSRGRRQIALDEDTVELLRGHRAGQVERRLGVGPAYVDRGLVFANAAGAPCDPTRVSHVFARTARRAGHAGVRLHDLRHFHATQLLATNTHIRVVQERLGHATISVTLGTYSHLIPGLDATAAEAAAAALRAARARRGASA